MDDDLIKMKMVIVVRRDLKMRRGKEIAQAGHAVLGAHNDSMGRWGPIGPDNDEWWYECGQKKVVLKAYSEEELLALAEKADAADIGHYLVRDAGRTEVPPNTPTVLAIGPDYEPAIDRITGHLELY